jgi:hypothetical protein
MPGMAQVSHCWQILALDCISTANKDNFINEKWQKIVTLLQALSYISAEYYFLVLGNISMVT